MTHAFFILLRLPLPQLPLRRHAVPHRGRDGPRARLDRAVPGHRGGCGRLLSRTAGTTASSLGRERWALKRFDREGTAGKVGARSESGQDGGLDFLWLKALVHSRPGTIFYGMLHPTSGSLACSCDSCNCKVNLALSRGLSNHDHGPSWR